MQLARWALCALLVSPALGAPHGAEFPLPPGYKVPTVPRGKYAGPEDGPRRAPRGGTTTPGGGPGSASTPAGPGGVPTAAGSAPGTPSSTGADPLSWTHWWIYHQSYYLQVKQHVHRAATSTGDDRFFLGQGEEVESGTLRPTEQSIAQEVVPALVRALTEERDASIRTGAMVALAKIGDAASGRETSLAELFVPLLADGNQEVAETAAIALGILRDERVAPMLIDLLRDRPAGRRAVDSTEVSLRTRAFAAFGLGLVAARTSDAVLRQRIAAHLIAELEGERTATPDLGVAAVTALGVVPLEWAPSPPDTLEEDELKDALPHVASRRALVDYLLGVLQRPRSAASGKGTTVRAHVPTALARLTADAPEELKDVVSARLLELVAPRSRELPEIQQGAASALGFLGDADAGGRDAEIRAALLRLAEDADQPTRRLAWMSLGRIAGRPGTGERPQAGVDPCRAKLLDALAESSTQVRPWVALALGIAGAHRLEAGLELDERASRDLRKRADASASPEEAGAYALALGLRRDVAALTLLSDKLESFRDDATRGRLALALGLLGERKALEQVRALVTDSLYRPELLRDAAITLALLDDKEAVPQLLDLLARANSQASQAAIAAALGRIGDARAVGGLTAMLNDAQLTAGARAFAAVALGITCDKDLLPWNVAFQVGVPFHSITATMVGEGRGVLEMF